jgi:hypothetical protein
MIVRASPDWNVDKTKTMREISLLSVRPFPRLWRQALLADGDGHGDGASRRPGYERATGES